MSDQGAKSLEQHETTAPLPANTEVAPARRDRRPSAHSGHGRRGQLLLLSLTALGVVYGDLGTSPLYSFRESFHGEHGVPVNSTNVFGVLSLTFWALMIVVTIKYIIFILRADNRGEGGILALTALATPIRRMSPSPQPWLIMLGLFGAAFLYGDGIITPAISVLSAVEGLTVASPLFTPYVIPLTIAIIIGLFMVQHNGSARIGRYFGPIMLIWFVVLAILGLMNVVQAPEVVGAINPIYAVTFFQANGWTGFLVLGSVFLVLTGGEALYADLGHFGRAPIRLGWFTIVLPALLLNYAGQGALLLREPAAAEHPLYLMAPDWARYPLIGLATVATVIASQALISGVFSITLQAEQLGFLPRQRTIHTSSSAYGQIYIPIVNWALMVACILVVIAFRSSSNLAAAFGIAVTSTMAITSVLFAVVARRRWKWSLWSVGLLTTLFLIVDCAFLAANLIKIPQGGWFPLVIAGAVFLIMTTWKRGAQLVFAREQELEMSLKHLMQRIRENPPLRVPGTAIFLNAHPGGAPAALLANLKYNGIVHERVLLLTVLTIDAPRLDDEQRTSIEELGSGIYRSSVRYGFMEEPNVPEDLAEICGPNFSLDLEHIPYFISRTRVIPTQLPGMAIWREHLFRLLLQNAASPVDFFCLPPSQVFEIGVSVEV